MNARAQVPSPEATGGSGSTFEARVGAIAFGRLLRGDRVPGLNLAPSRVRLQQRVAGAVLDDIVLDADEPLGGTRTVEYQVKRRISPAPGNADFVEVIRRCLTEIGAEERHGPSAPVWSGRRRFGIVSRPSTALDDLQRVTVVARSHDSARGFLEVVRGTARASVRERLDGLRETVAAVLAGDASEVSPAPDDTAVDTGTWRVARALFLWQLDAEPDGRDVLAAQDRLADLLRGRGDPAGVFRLLTDAVQEWAPQAGGINLGMLRAHLEAQGVALDETPARRAAFETLVTRSAALLDPAAARLGHRLHLPRTARREETLAALADHRVVLLTGRAGVGKSILGRLVAADLRAQGEVVAAVNLSGRTGSLADLEADIGVQLADGLAGAPIGGARVLLIDGAEQALADGAVLLTALLAAIPTEAGSAPPWQILLTAREESAQTLARLVQDRTGTDPHQVLVGELSDEEVAQVLEAFPVLVPLARSPRASALLLRRPYLVELLVRATWFSALPDGVAGEEDLVDIVMDRLVRRDEGGLPGRGAPDARADICLALADAVLANEVPARLDGSDAEARQGLSSDDVITRVRASWRFAHDILADYAVASRLLEPDGDTVLAHAVVPRRLLRAVRLRMQRQLADAAGQGSWPTAWTRATGNAEALAAADGPRWADVPWEALLHAGVARGALEALGPRLLADGGAGLVRLIDVTGRRARHPVSGDSAGPPPLDVTLTAPVVDFIAAHGGRVPGQARLPAARLVHEHLGAARGVGLPPDAGLEHVGELPDLLVTWAGGDDRGDLLGEVVGSLALLGGYLADRHDEFLAGHARRHPGEVVEAVESPLASAHLAVTRPDLLLRLAGLFYLGVALTPGGRTDETGRRPRSRMSFGTPFSFADDDLDDDAEGVRDHDPAQSRHLSMWPLGNNQSNPALGPFTALLNAAPRHGLQLVGAVVDAATASRTRLELGFEPSFMEPDLELTLATPAGTRRFTGPATVWLWYRRTGVGPGPALSALMALRAWAVRRTRSGEAPAVVRDDLLSAGSSLAFPAVAVSVLVDVIGAVTDELDMLLEHPLVWQMENIRVVHEHGGTALEVPDANRLDWTLSNVAMQLVLRGDETRRERLRRVGETLLANHAELGSADSQLLARRWASELDLSRYVAESQDDGLVVSVAYDDEVTQGLAAGGERAAESLRIAGLTARAIAIRDGKAEPTEAARLWREVGEAVSDGGAGQDGLYAPQDVLAAAAAAVVIAAAASGQVEDADLAGAVSLLVEGGVFFGSLAPPILGSPGTGADRAAGLGRGNSGSPVVHDMAWDLGADRSIATALPVLLSDPLLCARASVGIDAVAAAAEALAASPFHETRARLTRGLRRVWLLPCATHAAQHQAAVAVARRLIATAGYGPLRSWAHGYSRATLPEPLEDLLGVSDDMVLDVATASYAVDLLTDGQPVQCPHGRAASKILDVLIGYDERAWPRRYARHRYHRTDRWRQAIDAALAARILDGDTDALPTHLNAFAHVAEDLRGLLHQLPAAATTDARTARLFAIWPQILDRLLPDARDLSPRDAHDKRPYHRDIDDLDEALLLVPAPDGPRWPLRELVDLGLRWFSAFSGHARLADRAILFSARLFGFGHEISVRPVLSVLGENLGEIRRESRFAMPFLQAVLTNSSSGPAVDEARHLLDRLAADGDERALHVQQQLEA